MPRIYVEAKERTEATPDNASNFLCVSQRSLRLCVTVVFEIAPRRARRHEGFGNTAVLPMGTMAKTAVLRKTRFSNSMHTGHLVNPLKNSFFPLPNPLGWKFG